MRPLPLSWRREVFILPLGLYRSNGGFKAANQAAAGGESRAAERMAGQCCRPMRRQPLSRPVVWRPPHMHACVCACVRNGCACRQSTCAAVRSFVPSFGRLTLPFAYSLHTYTHSSSEGKKRQQMMLSQEEGEKGHGAVFGQRERRRNQQTVRQREKEKMLFLFLCCAGCSPALAGHVSLCSCMRGQRREGRRGMNIHACYK